MRRGQGFLAPLSSLGSGFSPPRPLLSWMPDSFIPLPVGISLKVSMFNQKSSLHVLDGSRHKLGCLTPSSSLSLANFGYLVFFIFSFTIVSQICSLPPSPISNSVYICLPLGTSIAIKLVTLPLCLHQPVLIDAKRSFPKCKQGHVTLCYKF